MTAPGWARSLVASVCADAGIEQPRLSWRRRAGEHSTGVDTASRRHRRGPRGDGRARPAPDPPPRAGALALAGSPTCAASGPPWSPVLRGRLRALSAPRPGRCRCVTPGVRPLRAARLRHAVALGVPGAAAALAEHRSTIRARPRRRWRVLVPSTASSSSAMAAGRCVPPAASEWSRVNLARIRRARRAGAARPDDRVSLARRPARVGGHAPRPRQGCAPRRESAETRAR